MLQVLCPPHHALSHYDTLCHAAGQDFTPNSQLFTVPAGSGPGDSLDFEVQIIDDQLVENDEDIVVTATIVNGPGSMFPDGTQSGSAILRILDDDGKLEVYRIPQY